MMNGKSIIWVLGVLVNLVFLSCIETTPGQLEAGQAPLAYAHNEHILNSTVQIIVIPLSTPLPELNGLNKQSFRPEVGTAITRGLGTLLVKDGQVFLVTHNHWGEMLQDNSLIEVRTADHALLARLFGFEFKNLISYQDHGTLVLKAAQSLASLGSHGLAGGEMGNSLAVQPGAVVQVAHRAAGNREVVDVLDAEVVSVDPYEGLPVFRLRTPDGQPMLPGDSGGGVWLDGKLVGNLWATFPKGSSPVDILPFVDPQAAEQGYRDLSLAARFPMKLDRLLRDMVRIDDSIE